MGYFLVEPDEAFRYALEVLKQQKLDGSIKQCYHVNGLPDEGLSTLEHSDGPVWLILCITAIIGHCQKPYLYDIIVPYQDGGRPESVLAHLKRAAFYMGAQVGAHGLCLMKDADEFPKPAGAE